MWELLELDFKKDGQSKSYVTNISHIQAWSEKVKSIQQKECAHQKLLEKIEVKYWIEKRLLAQKIIEENQVDDIYLNKYLEEFMKENSATNIDSFWEFVFEKETTFWTKDLKTVEINYKDEIKTVLYTNLWISDNSQENWAIKEFVRGVVDEWILANVELVEMLINQWIEAVKQIINALTDFETLKQIVSQVVKSFWDLFVWNAYEKWVSGASVLPMIMWGVGWPLREFFKMWAKKWWKQLLEHWIAGWIKSEVKNIGIQLTESTNRLNQARKLEWRIGEYSNDLLNVKDALSMDRQKFFDSIKNVVPAHNHNLFKEYLDNVENKLIELIKEWKWLNSIKSTKEFIELKEMWEQIWVKWLSFDEFANVYLKEYSMTIWENLSKMKKLTANLYTGNDAMFNQFIDKLPSKIPENRWPEMVTSIMWEWSEYLKISAKIMGNTDFMLHDQRLLLKQLIHLNKLVDFMQNSKKWFDMIRSTAHPEYLAYRNSFVDIVESLEKIIDSKEFNSVNSNRIRKVKQLKESFKWLINTI